MSDQNNQEKQPSSEKPGFGTPKASKADMFAGIPPGGIIPPPPDLEVDPAAAVNDNPPQAVTKKKGWLKNVFFNVATMATGAAVAYGVKTCAFAFLCASSPVAAIGITMLASAVSGGIVGGLRYGLNKYRGKENEDTLGVSIWKGAYRSALWGLVFGAAFGTFDFDKPDVATPAPETAVTPVVPTIEVPPHAPAVAEDPLAGMTAQQIKDEAVRLFNDGNPANDAYAVQLFNKAAEMGNYGAQIDKAYIEHWGLAGVPKDEFGSIESMYNTLESMDQAGVAHNPDFSHKPEYERGFTMLEQWLGIENTQAAIDTTAEDLVVEPVPPVQEVVSPEETASNEPSQAAIVNIMPQETAEQTQQTIIGTVVPLGVDPAESSKVVADAHSQSSATTEVTQSAETTPSAPVVQAAPESLKTGPVADSDGMVEMEINLGAASGGVNCENGWALIHKDEVSFACPMGPDAATPPVGTIMSITPPTVARPFLGR